jgi:hypothetical protein
MGMDLTRLSRTTEPQDADLEVHFVSPAPVHLPLGIGAHPGINRAGHHLVLRTATGSSVDPAELIRLEALKLPTDFRRRGLGAGLDQGVCVCIGPNV